MYMKAQHVQAQSMVMTASTVQSIQMLQYGHAELDAFLAEQAERNPFLDIGLPRPAAPLAATSGNDQPRTSSSLKAPMMHGERSNLEDYCAERHGLRDHLRNQLAIVQCDRSLRRIAEHLIESLDGDGYFRRNISEMAETLSVDEAIVETTLEIVQSFDPVGVGARNLQECLHLQLLERGWLTPPMARLLERLDLLAKFEVVQLSRHCGVSQEEVSLLATRVRLMNPRPGSSFDADPVIAAMPDLFVRRGDNDLFSIELNDALVPRVLINRRYYAQVRASGLGGPEKSFVTDCIHQAKWIARQLDQRANTILKVAAEIVAQQAAFFRNGPEYLRPLILRDVAEAVGVHPSTVCRAIANKFMLTDRGTFELRYFFANAISAGEGGEEHSSQAIRFRIRDMIDRESARSILSDDAIVTHLRGEGVDIARRTVAKYREMLRIPASSVRRRIKLAGTDRLVQRLETDRSNGTPFAAVM